MDVSMGVILVIILLIFAYGGINSLIELIPLMIYFLFYIGVVLLGCYFGYTEWKNIKNKDDKLGRVIVGFYIISCSLLPRHLFKVFGIILGDVYSARYVGLIVTIVVLTILHLIRINKRILYSRFLNGIFIVCLLVGSVILTNFGYEKYTRQVADRADTIQEYTVNEETAMIVEISVGGNQKMTLFGDFFITDNNIEYYYMGKPGNQHYSLKRMPAGSKLSPTGRTLYKNGKHVEVYCKENGLAGYIAEENLISIVDYVYVTNKDTSLIGGNKIEVDAWDEKTNKKTKSTLLIADIYAVIDKLPAGVEVVLTGEANAYRYANAGAATYVNVKTTSGVVGYVRRDDLDTIRNLRK